MASKVVLATMRAFDKPNVAPLARMAARSRIHASGSFFNLFITPAINTMGFARLEPLDGLHPEGRRLKGYMNVRVWGKPDGST